MHWGVLYFSFLSACFYGYWLKWQAKYAHALLQFARRDGSALCCSRPTAQQLFAKMELKKPEIKSWDCVEYDPIEEWQPDDPLFVEFWCNVAIGVKGEEGADNFLVHVVTERMLPQIKDKKYMLVLPCYEGWGQVLSSLDSKLDDINGLSWAVLSEKLSKIFYWEYEGCD